MPEKPVRFGIVPLCLMMALAGCQDQKAETPNVTAPKVVVAKATTQTVPLFLELTGRTEAPNTVSIRSRVDGHIESRSFVEGADVRKGDNLFVIDRRPYESELSRLKGERDSNQASLDYAKKEVERFAVLAKDGTVAPEQLDEKTRDAAQAKGDLDSSDGAVQSAQINVDYAMISAPIDGRIGRVYQDVGNVVSSNDTVLVDLVQMDPLHIYISPSERQFLELEKYRSKNPDLKVMISLIDGSTHPHAGVLDFSNPGVDPATGTIAVRAVFPNPEFTLRPGQYSRVRIELIDEEGQLTVPAEAIGQDQAGYFVYVVGSDNKAETRRVSIGRTYKSLRIVASGLQDGETVIVKGQQRVRTGETVEIDEPSGAASDSKADGLMLSRFFISRPIFASVIAIVIVIAGLISIPLLPVGEFPEVVPPTVVVSASYTGGSAEVVEEAVTIPLEEQINGVQGMVYMSSTSSNDGTSSITVTFEEGYDLNIAAMDTQNRVSTAMAQLPEEVIAAGVTVTKESVDLTLGVNLISPGGQLDDLFVSNYADIHITDRLKRIPGVGSVMVWGERLYAMRIWLDPEKLASLSLTASDVYDAVAEQNQQVAAGALGAPPTAEDQKFQLTLTTRGRLKSKEEFEDIILGIGADSATIRLKDVGRVELGATDYSTTSTINANPTVGLGIMQLPGANALQLASEVRDLMDELSQNFPEGLEYRIVYDTTNFDREAIRDVLFTLGQAVLLVVFVIVIFLPNLRAALIPVITIPVCLIGTFALMLALGFSINLLTLFGLVLAVGLVVDDAIVVVENVSRHIENGELDAKVAARRAMNEVTGPIVATSLVLMAVFIPVALMPGLTGKLYQQFALTIASAVAISAINALTLSPALCGLLLGGNQKKARIIQRFDAAFTRFTKRYEAVVGWFVRVWQPVALGFVVLLVGTIYMFTIVPSGFIPNEDQGYFIVSLQTPEGTALVQTEKVGKEAYEILHKLPGVRDVATFTGFSFLTNTSAPNLGTLFAVLEPWNKRASANESITAIMAEAQAQFNQIPGGIVAAFNPPPIFGLSPTGGFQFELQDTTGGALSDLEVLTDQLVAAGNARPELAGLFSPFSASTPQLDIELDRTKALTEGVSISDIFNALQTFLGGIYVNDFNIFGRVYKVYLQADIDSRQNKEDIGRLYVSNDAGSMVPLSALVTVKPQIGARTINHYNLFRSASINGAASEGYSSSQAIAAMDGLAKETLPRGYNYEWTGNAYQEIKAGNVAPILFALAVIFAFLFLAAQYESFVMPFMVLLAVPLAIFGALVAQWLRGYDNNIYCQIGLVMLIGLASKGAILIVEFARRRREDGLSVEEAAMEAARIRIRPLLMTAFAFILGVVPLVIATGAGSAARRSLGTAVFGGMIVATVLSLVLVPVLYVVIERLRERLSGNPSASN